MTREDDAATAAPGIDGIRAALDAALPPQARAWLDTALTGDAWQAGFASAGRHVGRRTLLPGTPFTTADAARILLLHAVRADADAVTALYRGGDAAERRAVLHALPYLPVGTGALELVEDALRTNDTRLVAAAVGPYAARHLDPHSWRHAVLKCVFTGVPVSAVAGLAERADAELARMLARYAEEREAAGRPVPQDVHRVLALVPAAAGPEPGTPEDLPSADQTPADRTSAGHPRPLPRPQEA